MKKVIENIGKQIIDKFFDFDNNEYELTGDIRESENGLYEAGGLHISFNMNIGEHAIGCSVDTTHDKLNYVEAIFEEYDLENVEQALNEYLQSTLDVKSLYIEATEHYAENTADEFQRNGFANEADYWRYRLSA